MILTGRRRGALLLVVFTIMAIQCTGPVIDSEVSTPAAPASPLPEIPNPATTEASVPTETPEPTSAVIVDYGIQVHCNWDGVVRAWLDTNENGQWEENEPPMPGIRFLMRGETFQLPRTDWNGETMWYAYARCADSNSEIIASVPPGYYLTTEGSRLVSEYYNGRLPPFGFAVAAGLPTATPRPPDPQCEPMPVTSGEGLAVAPDGAVWIATSNGVIRFDPIQQSSTQYTVEDGLASNKVNAVATAADGSIWFGTDAGVTYYIGSSWVSYTRDDGLSGGAVMTLAAVDDGTVWAGSENSSLSHFDPGLGHWTRYQRGPITAMAIAPDGSVWFATKRSLAHVSTPVDGQESLTWQTYRVPFDVDSFASTGKMAIVGGRIWIAGLLELAQFDPQTEEWLTYEPSSHWPYISIASAGEDAIWVGAMEGLFHFRPELGNNNPHAWRIYKEPVGIDDEPILYVVPGEDGVLWVGRLSGLARCQLVVDF